MKQTFILLAALAVISSGCKMNLATPDRSPQTSPPPDYLAWSPSSSDYGWMQTTTLRYMMPMGHSDAGLARGIFFDTTGAPTLASSLKLNSIPLGITSDSDEYVLNDDTIPYGISQTWTSTASSSVPSFSLSITPPSRFSITLPKCFR